MILFERTMLRQLFASQNYAERVAPYLKDDYFPTAECAVVFGAYQKFFDQYHTLPSFAVIRLALDSVPDLSESQAKQAATVIDELEQTAPQQESQHDYLIAETEKFCQERALYIALRRSVTMLDNPKENPHAIPDILKEALAVSFDTHVGHDFFEDAASRYDFYHRAEARIPFDLDVFNSMTKNGIPAKSLNVVLAGTNVGKSLFLVHMAAACARMSKNVLYITLEMAEERIAERIDANLMDIPMDDVIALSRDRYLKKLDTIRQTSTGRLLIKEYPTAAAHTGHFRALLHELKLKQNFTPDILFVDYLSICASSRLKLSGAVNTYLYNKSIAEELRGLAVEMKIPIFTAAQFNRDGSSATDPGLDKISESFAIAQTADFIFAMTTSEELEKNNQIQVYVLKNRYAKRQSYQKFILGIDTSRMKLYDTGGTVQPTAAPPEDFNTGSFSKPAFSRSRRRPLAHLKTDDE